MPNDSNLVDSLECHTGPQGDIEGDNRNRTGRTQLTEKGISHAIKFHNAGPHTIWGKLAAQLGREPTDAEAKAEVKRILKESRECN